MMIYTKNHLDKRKKLSSGSADPMMIITDKVSEHVTESLQTIKAVKEGDYAAISKRLSTGQSLMSIREPGTGSTISHIAARHGDKAILKLLVRKYSDYVKMSNNQGRTPVHEAAEYGKFECLTYLLQHGALARTRDSDGITPLMLSAQKGHIQTLRRLALADPEAMNSKDTNGLNALHHSSAQGQYMATKWLVEFGLDNQAKDKNGCTPMHHAILNDNLKCAIWLQQFSQCDVRHINNKGYNACHLAAQHGHLDILRWLLSNKLVNPDEPGGHYGSTPVHEAAENGQLGSLHCLRAFNANMHKKNFNDKSPRDLAAAAKYTECVKYLDSIKKPKGEKKEKRANSLSRMVQQALSISESEKTPKSSGTLLPKTKRKTKGESDKSQSDGEDTFSPCPIEKLNFKTLNRRSKGGSVTDSMDDNRSIYSNGSYGSSDRRSGNYRSFNSWEHSMYRETSLTKSLSSNEILSLSSMSPPSSKFDIMSVLREEQRRQRRLRKNDYEEETASLRSGSSFNGRARSRSFMGSQDTVDRLGSVSTAFSGPCSPSFQYIPSPPPRSTSTERNNLTYENRTCSPSYMLSPEELISMSDRSSLALSDSSGESNRPFMFSQQKSCPVHSPVSPTNLNTAGDFKKIFDQRKNARMNTHCTCRNSGEIPEVPERNYRLSRGSSNGSWVSDQPSLSSPRPEFTSSTTLQRRNNSNDLTRLNLEGFKQNWGTKTLAQTTRRQPDAAYSPQNFGILHGQCNKDNARHDASSKHDYYYTENGPPTFRTSTNLSDICKL